MKRSKYKKPSLLLAVFVTPLLSVAQENSVAKNTDSYLSNALFLTLAVCIIILMCLIAIMANVLKNITQSKYVMDKLKKTDSSNTSNISGLVAFFMLLSLTASAQENVNYVITKDNWLIGGLDMFTFYFMVAVILVEVSVLAFLLITINGFLKTDAIEIIPAIKKVKEKTILDKFNASVDIEKEGEILLDHNYDGIQELDNNLPPWWKYGFYLTIAVAVVYLIHYHVAKTGDLQIAEYTKSLEKAKADIDAYMKTAANNVDETTVKPLTGSDLDAGKETFVSTCAACHGRMGEGGVGPNLTDDYWLHGGSIQDIFKTIKYGWPDKGMKSWKEDLSPTQIAQVASYIKTLRGTNPPKGKAPQGDLYKENGVAPLGTDSLSNPTDTSKVKAVTDSLEIVKGK